MLIFEWLGGRELDQNSLVPRRSDQSQKEINWYQVNLRHQYQEAQDGYNVFQCVSVCCRLLRCVVVDRTKCSTLVSYSVHQSERSAD